MVDSQTKTLDRVFHALSDETRREILRRIARRECTVGELAAPFKMSLSAVSKHIKVLENARLLKRTRDGRVHRCMMDPRPLKQASDVISYYQQFWDNHFDQMERYFEKSGRRKSNHAVPEERSHDG